MIIRIQMCEHNSIYLSLVRLVSFEIFHLLFLEGWRETLAQQINTEFTGEWMRSIG